MEKLEPLYTVDRLQNSAASMKKLIEVLQKTAIELPYIPAISLLCIYPKERKTGSWRDIHIHMFMGALFTVAKRWKQLRYPWTNKWINKVSIYIQWNIIQS